jgi:hypothetical protein
MDATALHPKVMSKLPDMAVYGPGVAGHVKRKTVIPVPPIQGSQFTPNSQRVIQIFLPKNGFLNGLNSYLVFNHQSANTPSATAGTDRERNALSSSASNWIQRFRLKIGGKIVEDVDDYNVIHEIMRTHVVTQPFTDSLSGALEGYQSNRVQRSIDYQAGLPAGVTPNVRLTHNRSSVRSGTFGTGNNARSASDADSTLQAWAQDGKQYQVILLSGFLGSRKYIPLRFLPPVEIELTLADFARCHVWAPPRANGITSAASGLRDQWDYYGGLDTTTAITGTPASEQTYTISNVNYMAEVLEFDETFYQAFEMSLAQGVTIPYTTFTNHVFSHTGTSTDFQIAERVRSAKSVFAVMRTNADLAYAAYPKFVFTRNNLSQFQVKIGTQYFPLQPIEIQSGAASADEYSGVRLMELTKVVSAMGDVTNAIFTNTHNYRQHFVLGIDLDREFNRLSGLDTTKGLPLFLSLRHSTPGAACVLNVFVNYDMFVDLFPGEVIEVLN